MIHGVQVRTIISFSMSILDDSKNKVMKARLMPKVDDIMPLWRYVEGLFLSTITIH